MTGFVHVEGEKAERSKKAIFSVRKARTKMMLFSKDVVVFILMVCVAGSLMLFNSYLKAFRNSQNVDIVKRIEIKRELILKKNEINGAYLKMSSSAELMKKADELQLSVVTLDKVMHIQ